MKKFKVTACYYTYCTAVVEAEDVEQAYEIALDMDGGSFDQHPTQQHDWHINDVQEIDE